MLFDTKNLSKSLNIDDNGPIEFDTTKDEKWDCYNDRTIKKMSNTTALYWNNLSEDQRKERLKNHGMIGKKHSQKTKDKMSKSATGTKRPSLHKKGVLIKDGKVVEFSCLSHFCKEHKLSSGHICELMQGKRKSVKGWKKYA